MSSTTWTITQNSGFRNTTINKKATMFGRSNNHNNNKDESIVQTTITFDNNNNNNNNTRVHHHAENSKNRETDAKVLYYRKPKIISDNINYNDNSESSLDANHIKRYKSFLLASHNSNHNDDGYQNSYTVTNNNHHKSKIKADASFPASFSRCTISSSPNNHNNSARHKIDNSGFSFFSDRSQLKRNLHNYDNNKVDTREPSHEPFEGISNANNNNSSDVAPTVSSSIETNNHNSNNHHTSVTFDLTEKSDNNNNKNNEEDPTVQIAEHSTHENENENNNNTIMMNHHHPIPVRSAPKIPTREEHDKVVAYNHSHTVADHVKKLNGNNQNHMTTYAVRGKGDFHPSHYHQVSDGAVSGGGNVYYASDDTLASTTNQTFRNQLRNNHKSISVYYTSSFQCYDNSNNRLNTRQSVFPSTSNHPFCLDHVVNQYNLSRYHDGVHQVTGDDRKPISCRSMTRVNQDSVKDRIDYNNNNKENDINNSKCMKLSVNKDKIDLMQNCNFRGTNKNRISNPLIERQNEVNNRLLSIHCELENNKTKHNSEIFYSNIDPKLYLTSSIPVIEHNSTSFHNNNNNPVEDSKGMVHSHLPDDTHSDDTASLHNHNQNTDHDINAAEARHLLRFPPLLSPLLVEVQQRVPLARVWGANRYHQTQLLLAAGFSKTEVEVILWELRRLIRNTSTECVC